LVEDGVSGNRGTSGQSGGNPFGWTKAKDRGCVILADDRQRHWRWLI
jgi:hypothetical protein